MDVLACLKKYGQRLDSEIAAEVNMSLADVRTRFAKLSESGEVLACKLTRFDNGTRVDALVYRASGYFPRPAPGRKPKGSVAS
jgi:DNA-binding Lrp family transcriptional regulator